MAPRLGIALAICLGMGSVASSQVVRFETNAGNFDMVLNPTNLPVLQGHVDNLLQYVENGNYNGVWINRAGETGTGEEFVLQMGGFYSQTVRPPMTLASARPVSTFDPVLGEPASETGLSNTFGTVAMALRGGDQNSGTSSFFINTRDNSASLDANFTVFAVISDMTVINQIMALPNLDLTDPSRQPPFTGDSTTFGDVPILPNGHQVFIRRAFVVTDSMLSALAMTGAMETLSNPAAASAVASGGGSSSLPPQSAGVPEPSSLLMAVVLGCAPFAFGRRRRS